MTTPFKFHRDIRPHVKALCELMEYANSRGDRGEWSYQVYTPASKALDAVVKATMGDEIYERLRHGYNFGGNGSWLEDVEVAVQEAMDQIAEEMMELEVES